MKPVSCPPPSEAFLRSKQGSFWKILTCNGFPWEYCFYRASTRLYQDLMAPTALGSDREQLQASWADLKYHKQRDPPHTTWAASCSPGRLSSRYPPKQLMQQAAGSPSTVFVKRISKYFSTISISIYLHASLEKRKRLWEHPTLSRGARALRGQG